ncbi:hypothetical protein F3Y22_tig00110201pilonHSYRG00242 [Hibiscus syriacus]|uniref:Uncharacterized protein n=1 Tax=Hibiscus syriacus TaxID=106335 RepID=A0A6A3BH64_HIBSY|nr:hypothetical protein F3Y22_tig00110201pilonHSYRG00242 [Hibiscus syriacus]
MAISIMNQNPIRRTTVVVIVIPFPILILKIKRVPRLVVKVTMVGAPLWKADGPSRWQFPRTPMLDYGGGPRPHYQPFRPYHPPPMMGRLPGPSHYPFGRAPLVPPYGVFISRSPPMVNPMIHYTSYADNYIPW